MSQLVEKKSLAHWTQLLEQHQQEVLLMHLREAPTVEVAEFLTQQPVQQLLTLFVGLPDELQGIVFAEFWRRCGYQSGHHERRPLRPFLVAAAGFDWCRWARSVGTWHPLVDAFEYWDVCPVFIADVSCAFGTFARRAICERVRPLVFGAGMDRYWGWRRRSLDHVAADSGRIRGAGAF